MNSTCTGFSLLWGIGALCAGFYTIAVAAAGRAIFVITGFFTFAAQMRCANIANEFSSLTHLRYQPWLPVWAFTLLAAAIGFANARRQNMSAPLIALAAVLTAAFGFCGAEAASYHVGEMANRWSTAAIIAALLSWVPFGLDWIANRPARS